MFNKKELCTLLEGLESNRGMIMTHCIYCDIVEYRSDYTKTKYCVNYCNVCKNIEEIDSLILKIKMALK